MCYVCACACVFVRARACVCVYVCVCGCECVRAHTHAYTHTRSLSLTHTHRLCARAIACSLFGRRRGSENDVDLLKYILTPPPSISLALALSRECTLSLYHDLRIGVGMVRPQKEAFTYVYNNTTLFRIHVLHTATACSSLQHAATHWAIQVFLLAQTRIAYCCLCVRAHSRHAML